MVVERDIVAISIPFTAGVAAVAVLPPCGEDFIYKAALVSSIVLAGFLLLSTVRRTGFSPILPTFFFIGILCACNARINAAAAPDGFHIAERALERFASFIDSMDFGDERTAPLVKALLTGRKESLTQETVNTFRTSGAAHILALSGLHLGVIYGILTKLLSVLGNSRGAAIVRSSLTILAAGFYTMMTGAGPSIVRAFLFITMNELLRLMPGRRREPLSILCAALTVQLAASPMVIKSVGFQLSYLSMLGIFTVFPRLDAWYPESGRFDIMRKIWSSAALSLSCQIFTAPVVWYYFHTFPEYFLLTNLLALPLSEGLIVSSAICIPLEAAGCCPDILKSPVDFLARALIFCLETVTKM